MNNKFNRIIDYSIGLIIISLNIAVWFLVKNLLLSIIVVSLSAVVILLYIIRNIKAEKDNEKVLTDLSDLISSISSLNVKKVFCEYDENICSKLQSQVVRLVEILKNQTDTLENEKDSIKTLVSDISHQLKTPVAGLRIYGEYLLDDTLDNETKRNYYEIFSNTLDKLTFLTDNLIKMSRLETGIIKLNKEKSSLNDTILDSVMQAYHSAEQKEVEIVFDSDKLKIELEHDSRWTAEAIYNVIENAIKYCYPHTQIIINLVKYEIFARIDITDYGRLISQDETNKIFSRFYRGSNSANTDGLGIGLYLSREIINSHNGYIKVKSDNDSVTFSIFLPL